MDIKRIHKLKTYDDPVLDRQLQEIVEALKALLALINGYHP